MAKKIRATVVDPETCTVKEVETAGTLGDLHALIGAPALDNFRIADHGDSYDYGWVSDIGLASGKPVHAFKFRTGGDPVAGRCVFIGADKRGRTTDARVPVQFWRDQIIWLGVIVPEVFWEDTGHGAHAIVTYSRPKA
jgi:hypothetical protein